MPLRLAGRHPFDPHDPGAWLDCCGRQLSIPLAILAPLLASPLASDLGPVDLFAPLVLAFAFVLASALRNGNARQRKPGDDDGRECGAKCAVESVHERL